jgi:hypothetical protein
MPDEADEAGDAAVDLAVDLDCACGELELAMEHYLLTVVYSTGPSSAE